MLARKVAFLSASTAYPGAPPVKAKETHMSWVFLAGVYAYKLKKPVRYEFLDFSTLEARRINCNAEASLNRRLAPEIYLGVIPLVETEEGEYRLDGKGPVAEWLVKMRRLPDDATLEQEIVSHSLREEDVRRLVAHLVAFYESAEKVGIDASTYRLRIEADIRAAYAELSRPEFILPQTAIDWIQSELLRFASVNTAILESRGARLVDGHGDLRPEHVYLSDPPAVIDCIEFNREFRILDPVDELSYLAMECERLGGGSFSNWILRAYRELTKESCSEELVRFYKAYRAFVRAKVAIWHLRDAVTDPTKWRGRAEDYLRLAQAYLA